MPGCAREYRCKGFCALHYNRWRTTGNAGPGDQDSTRAAPGIAPVSARKESEGGGAAAQRAASGGWFRVVAPFSMSGGGSSVLGGATMPRWVPRESGEGSAMGRPRRSRSGAAPELDLLSSVGRPMLAQRLELGWWPDQARFPVNRATAKVRPVVWADLVGCSDPLVVTGFASIDQLVDLIGAWGQAGHQGRLRIGLGWEPFASATSGFGPPRGVFTDTVRGYWQDRGVSLEACGRLVQAVELVRAGRVQVRFAHGDWRCHAKVYATEQAVTMGSSNFTATGLTGQIEANTRFEAATDAVRHHEACQVAERIWEVSEPWEQDFLDLLEGLLRFTSWQEALARACAELIEGDWAGAYLPAQTAGTGLWPSQVAGIAQALWILESVGSVLVADATGSGKTRMGAHLARASVDWLWGTGRVRGTAPAVLVAPPGVRQAWRDEGDQCQMTFRTYSQGDLSTTDPEKAHRVTSALARAQLLAVDEAHNYLSTTSLRTQRLMGHGADHVMLFTATPISRGARDLLQLVRLLGVDNFDDTTIEVLRTLERAPKGATLAHEPLAQLRREIQRFTVRRTKPMLNTAVDADPEAYRDPDSGQVNRYPAHTPHAYDTGETDTDQQVALAIRAHAGALRGLGNLGTSVTRPIGLPVAVTDQRFLEIRLAAAAGLAAYQVTDALRSSRAALLEHILGTGAAADYENIPTGFKASDSGDQLARTLGLAGGPPPALDLRAQPPDWLTDPTEWEAACRTEAEHYRAIHELACQLSDAREKAKATLIVDLQRTHQQVLVFDRHPISLAVLTSHLQAAGATNVLIATGSTTTGKKQVTRALARSADQPAIALCSDALNEGLNLQGAPVIVHLDLPTTLRVAEQRVGRVERMNTRHPRIESWWPRDSAAFATRARERLQARKNESEQLLGANLDLPPVGPA